MDTSIADEIERLRTAELEAEQRYFDAMKREDLPTARAAAVVWSRAADALTAYVATHTDLYRESG
jgi:hypothetical protein